MSGEIRYKHAQDKQHIYWREVRGCAGDIHNLLIGETVDGQQEEILYRKGSIISKKIAVWRIKKLLRCY